MLPFTDYAEGSISRIMAILNMQINVKPKSSLLLCLCLTDTVILGRSYQSVSFDF